MDKAKMEAYLKSVALDFKNIKFNEDEEYISLKIGNYFIRRKKTDDYDYDMKKLFEDFVTSTTSFYIKLFWEQ